MWLVSIPVMDSFLSASISIKNASQDLKTEQRGDEEQEISIMAILRFVVEMFMSRYASENEDYDIT